MKNLTMKELIRGKKIKKKTYLELSKDKLKEINLL